MDYLFQDGGKPKKIKSKSTKTKSKTSTKTGSKTTKSKTTTKKSSSKKGGNFLGAVGDLVAPTGWGPFATAAGLLALDRADSALRRGKSEKSGAKKGGAPQSNGPATAHAMGLTNDSVVHNKMKTYWLTEEGKAHAASISQKRANENRKLKKDEQNAAVKKIEDDEREARRVQQLKIAGEKNYIAQYLSNLSQNPSNPPNKEELRKALRFYKSINDENKLTQILNLINKGILTSNKNLQRGNVTLIKNP